MFPEKTERFELEVDLVAEMTVINPFDFFLESDATSFPFTYTPSGWTSELAPYLQDAAGRTR